ncbi:MAG: hypothetical protein M0P47_11880, partial [Bacteroidales bacterium]|nr:hypothetical protein [Bacteroidales bacterium]
PFLPKTGWVSAGMAHFSDGKIDTVDWIFYRNQWVGMLRFIQAAINQRWNRFVPFNLAMILDTLTEWSGL